MRTYCAAIVVCAMSILAGAQCKPEVKKEIDAVRDTWVKDWNTRNLDGLMGLYTQDAVVLPSGGSRVVGKNPIRAMFEKEVGSTVTIESVTVECSDELAYDSGSYTASPADTQVGQGQYKNMQITSGRRKHLGNYLVVLKQMTGNWLIVQDASTLFRR
jgi:uncharacterized protein (TIGR02246 family)